MQKVKLCLRRCSEARLQVVVRCIVHTFHERPSSLNPEPGVLLQVIRKVYLFPGAGSPTLSSIDDSYNHQSCVGASRNGGGGTVFLITLLAPLGFANLSERIFT